MYVCLDGMYVCMYVSGRYVCMYVCMCLDGIVIVVTLTLL